MSGCCSDVDDNKKNRDNDDKNYRYRIQIGVYRTYNKAMMLQQKTMEEGFMSDIDRQGDLFVVFTGEFAEIDKAAVLEYYLRCLGYNTLVIAL